MAFQCVCVYHACSQTVTGVNRWNTQGYLYVAIKAASESSNRSDLLALLSSVYVILPVAAFLHAPCNPERIVSLFFRGETNSDPAMATATESHVNNEPGDRRGNAPFKKPSGKGKPRTKQPKKVKFITTEIRCQEKSKGGLRYEVILAEPTVPKRAPSPPQTSPTQQVAIEDKLRAAEERRLSLEAHKLAALAAKLSKIEEAARKKDELSAAFIAATRESLDAKMNHTVEKREAHIAELKNKLKEHFESVEKSRLSLEQQTEEVRLAVEEKLKTAAAQRDENIKRMLERFKEHEEQAARVRQAISERVQQLETQIQGKLDQARERRENLEREQKEKLRNYNTVKIAKVRETAEDSYITENEKLRCIYTSRIYTAEKNRHREIQRRVQAIRQHERRAELVRQNKAALSEQTNLPAENETASSG